MKKRAVVKIGTFGLHILKCPSGKYKFAGTVPAEIHETRTETKSELFKVAVNWAIANNYPVNI